MPHQLDTSLPLIEECLGEMLTNSNPPTTLMDAMRYSALAGGKRIRPRLTLAASRLSHAEPKTSLTVGCAIELIHCFSLIHDDLPAMDNDDLRRGIPTCHKKYDEATAILAGDALQAFAFQVLSDEALQIDRFTQLKIINMIAASIGPSGMVLGQSLDILSSTSNNYTNPEVATAQSNTQAINFEQLKHIHNCKTGCLIKASVMSGYLCGPNTNEAEYLKLENIASMLGLLFQIIDDVLDATEDSATLGKTANKDVVQDKLTYVNLLGLEQAQQEAKTLYLNILTELDTIPNNHELLGVIELVYNRHY